MTIRHKTFGPEQLLGAPRKTPGFPSPDGKRFVFTQSVYSFESHSKSQEVVVYEFVSGQQTVVSRDAKASQPRWLNDSQLVWLRDADNGNTSFIVAEADASGKAYTAGTVAGGVSNLKVYHIEDGMVAVAVAGQANPDGSIYNAKDAPKPQSTAKLYDATFVRHWDSYVTKERNAVFTAVLQKAAARVHGRDGRFHLTGFKNALKGTGLECPIPPWGGTDHFDIGRQGLVFVAKDPELDPATHTRCDAYLIRKEDLMELSETPPRKISVQGFKGAATSPVMASDGSLAWLQMRTDGYESDQNYIIHASVSAREPTEESHVREFKTRVIDSPNDAGHSSRFRRLSPGSLIWSLDSKTLYAQAEYHGAGCLWAVPVHAGGSGVKQLTHKNFITEALPVPRTRYMLVSGNSLIDNSMYTLINVSGAESSTHRAPEVRLLAEPSYTHNRFGLSPSQVDELWWTGDHDHRVHALMMRPSTFDASKKYPLAFLVHGGPQGAWNDQWSTRWNMALFAEQGYVVVAPNPTGSTGYGQRFTDAIRENWGGSPYIDLEKGIEYISENVEYVDAENMVALGASYGGYMMNWMAGHPLGRKFKALVCHDGVFSMTGQLASEEQYFPVHDMGGPIWEKQEVYDRWDPARHVKNWQTPMLIIHNELDYRLTVAEGLSAFNVLQGKGIESRYLTFSDEGHWVLREENALVWCLVVLNWCNKFVGLPEVTDRNGSNGNEYCQQGKRTGHGKELRK